MAMKETFRNFRKRIFKEFGIKDPRNLFGEVLNSKRRSRLGIGVQDLDKDSTWNYRTSHINAKSPTSLLDLQSSNWW